jgi:hypothetical protein
MCEVSASTNTPPSRKGYSASCSCVLVGESVPDSPCRPTKRTIETGPTGSRTNTDRTHLLHAAETDIASVPVTQEMPRRRIEPAICFGIPHLETSRMPRPRPTITIVAVRDGHRGGVGRERPGKLRRTIRPHTRAGSPCPDLA